MDLESKTQKQTTSKTPQIIAAFTANIGAFALGQALSWSSPALPFISNCGENCDVPDVGVEAGSWIGSLLAIGALMGAMLGGSLMSRIGLRYTMILMAVPFTLGWLILYVTKPFEMSSPLMFFAGRILTGIGGGSFALLSPAYTAETAELEIRGAMGSLMQFMLTIGVLFNNAVGALISWTTLTAICGVFPVLVAVGMFFMPESPFFLISQERESDARKALQWLRGSQCNVSDELQEIKNDFKKKQDAGEVSFASLFSIDYYVKPLIIVLLLMFFQQYSGINGVLFYLQDLFDKAGTNIDSGLSSTLVTLAQVLVTGVAVVLVDKFGRRILLILSGIFMGISLLGLAAFFYLDVNKDCSGLSDEGEVNGEEVQCVQDGFDPEFVQSLGPLPLVSLIVYIVAFSIGFGPLPWVINGEFFSLEAKGKAATVATVVNWTCAFLVSKFQVNVEAVLTTAGSYVVYAVFCFLSVFFLIFAVPESKGKTPDEMKKYFQK